MRSIHPYRSDLFDGRMERERDVYCSSAVIDQKLGGDSGGRAGPLSNTITLELPVGPGAGQTSQAGQTGQDYTVLGAVLGAITVLTLLTVALLVCWLLRRRRGVHPPTS